jgi:hypothetical protein
LAVLGCLAAVPWGWALDPAAAMAAAAAPASLAEAKAAPSLALDLSPAIGAPPGRGGAKPLDLGLRWRQPVASEQHVDVTAWRRTDPPAFPLAHSREPVYGARVEMNLKPSRTRFVATHRFVGLQLESGDRILLRRSDGNATLYYRTRF